MTHPYFSETILELAHDLSYFGMLADQDKPLSKKTSYISQDQTVKIQFQAYVVKNHLKVCFGVQGPVYLMAACTWLGRLTETTTWIELKSMHLNVTMIQQALNLKPESSTYLFSGLVQCWNTVIQELSLQKASNQIETA